MTVSGSYDVHSTHRDAESEIKRLAAQARLGWDKESRNLAWFGLVDGISLIELGSGPGFITEQLLALYPNSHLTCLELDTILIDQARNYLQGKGVDRIRFVSGSVIESQLPGNSFDFAYARLLFQHLPDPLAAAKEIYRILKPGGRLAIYDIDDEIFGLIKPPIIDIRNILEKFGQAQAALGGNRQIGRRLWGIMEAAGFTNLDLEVIAIHSDQIGIQPFLPQIDPDRMLPLVKMGMVSEQEIDDLRAARTKFLNSQEPYILTLSLMVCGEKLE